MNKMMVFRDLYRTPMVILAFGLFCCVACSKDEGGTVDPPVETQKDLAAVDNAITAFMSRYSVPGVSIAVTRNDQLVYVKSYGQMSASDPTPVNNNSLFRIASVSKPVTGVAIMKLLEAGKLTLDSKVFGTGGILGNDYPSSNLASVSDITVRQLLHHTSGGWQNDGTDPMFQQTSLNQSQLISWTLNNYPNPAANRGSYRYSNFGYCVLGRVIEKVSGKTYEQYVKDDVLAPAGITTMTIGGNTLAERKANEVLYTGQSGENPYVYNIARMDAHGGWIASAKDLAKLLVRVNGVSAKADQLQASTITTMTTRSVPSSFYACGWQVNDANTWWHLGSLPGTAAEIIRTNNGYTWVILCNTRGNSDFFNALDNLWWQIDAAKPTWQDIDQF